MYTNLHLGNMVLASFVWPSSTPLRRFTNTLRRHMWTTVRTASASGKAAMPQPKTSSSAPSFLVTSLAMLATVHTHAATKAATKHLPLTRLKTITRGRTRANVPMYAIAADIQQPRTHSCKPISVPYTRARSRTNVASASSPARTRVT